MNLRNYPGGDVTILVFCFVEEPRWSYQANCNMISRSSSYSHLWLSHYCRVLLLQSCVWIRTCVVMSFYFFTLVGVWVSLAGYMAMFTSEKHQHVCQKLCWKPGLLLAVWVEGIMPLSQLMPVTFRDLVSRFPAYISLHLTFMVFLQWVCKCFLSEKQWQHSRPC